MTRLYRHPNLVGFAILLVGFAALSFLGGCTTTIPGCLPSSDLGQHKVMERLPETDTSVPDFFALFAKERKQHASDIRDYNSLLDQCVGAQ